MSSAVALQTLNAEQQKAVDWPGSALVLSGAGTGKTRVITARVQRLLAEGAEPRSVLTVTFTNKAAREMKERIGARAAGMFIGTFHSLGLRILRAHAEAAGLPPSFQILDQAEQTALVRRILQEVLGLPKPTADGPEPRDIRSAIERFKQHGLRPDQVAEGQGAEHALEAYVEYERLCRLEGKVDFNELLLRPCELLSSNKEIRASWASRYAHILIDELQDTNEQQMLLLRLLKGPDTVMFGVGDDDQSIYKFRGAFPRVLEVFAKEHVNEQAGGKIFKLERNYRSSKHILALANAVIAENSDRIGKRLYGDDAAGDLPVLTCYRDEEDEARMVASQIAALRDAGEPLDEIAVFYRNSSLSQLVEQALSRAGVKYTVRGGIGFLARAEIKTAIAYLQVAAQRENIDAVLRSVNSPPRKIGDKGKAELAAAAQQGRLWETIAQAGHAGVAAYAAIIDQIAEHAANGELVEAVRTAVVGSGWQEYLAGRREREKAELLDEMINVAARFAEDAGEPEAILDRFLEAVVLDSGPDDSGDRGVSLLTIHGSKGLEFEHVFLIGIENGILPGPHENDDGLAEERRLLHVAVTRAKRTLHLSYARRRRFRGYWLDRKRTSLLQNVDATLWQSVGEGPRPADNSGSFFSARPARQPERQPEHKASLNGLTVGQRVKSRKFGAGVVLALQGEGELAKARVLFFANHKTRWLMLNMAKLEPLADKR